MTDNEFLLQDRLQKIRQIINKYDENNFYMSYSGGMDSNVLSVLLDMAIPENKIPRVYCNTGIEYKMIVDFVKAKAEQDDRFVIIKPTTPIKQMLEQKGYPFKSKMHSQYMQTFYKSGINCKTVQRYLRRDPTVKSWRGDHCCPRMLEYQFEEKDALDFVVSDKCCHELKVGPLTKWQKENNKLYKIIGIMASEGGGEHSKQLVWHSKKTS